MKGMIMGFTLDSMNTERKLLEMWQENTGTHFLDSGGASGRNWQRNQGKTLEDMEAIDGYFERDFHVFFNTFTFLLKHITYTKESANLTDLFRAWVDDTPKGEAFYNTPGSMEEFLLEHGAEPQWMDDRIEAFNTYNWDNYADAVLQGVPFALGDRNYVALSYHGGADVRGGYSDLVIFESCTCWIFATSDIELYCKACGIHAFIRGMHDMDMQRQGEEFEPASNYDVLSGCPDCKGDWEVSSPECSGD